MQLLHYFVYEDRFNVFHYTQRPDCTYIIVNFLSKHMSLEQIHLRICINLNVCHVTLLVPTSRILQKYFSHVIWIYKKKVCGTLRKVLTEFFIWKCHTYQNTTVLSVCTYVNKELISVAWKRVCCIDCDAISKSHIWKAETRAEYSARQEKRR
jgi:hypothetical protein